VRQICQPTLFVTDRENRLYLDRAYIGGGGGLEGGPQMWDLGSGIFERFLGCGIWEIQEIDFPAKCGKSGVGFVLTNCLI
jgi:hypothetical protein